MATGLVVLKCVRYFRDKGFKGDELSHRSRMRERLVWGSEAEPHVVQYLRLLGDGLTFH